MLAHPSCVQALVDSIEKGAGFSPEAGNSVWLQFMRFQHRVASTMQEAQDKCRRIFMKVYAHSGQHIV